MLGSQVGCAYIDEVNITDMEFLREITHRCKYMLTISNPDAPDKDVYKEFINRSRPLKRHVKDYPPELLEELKGELVKGYIHWYFIFYDNAAKPIAPSDTVVNYIAFLERNRKEWRGIAKNIFVDSADQAALTEFAKYKRAHPECLYHSNNAYKK